MKRLDSIRAQPILSISITLRCSLQCGYCVSNMFNPASQRDNFIDAMGTDKFLEKLHDLFKHKFPMQTSIPGTGEPTESPHFAPLLEKLLEWGNNVTVQTNLNMSDKFEDVLSAYSKEEVHKRVKVVTSYHVGRFLDLGERGAKLRGRYLNDHFPRIANLGCDIVQVVTPMTPKAIRDGKIVEDYAYLYSLSKFQPIITELFHFYEGKTWPRDYTPEDRQLLAGTRTKIFAACHYDPHSLHDVPDSEQVKYSTAALELHGMTCYKPMYHLDILATGQLRICQASPDWILGTFADMTPAFVQSVFGDAPVSCPAKKCLCRSAGISGCLAMYGISTNEYYYAWYMQQGKNDIAKLFKSKEKIETQKCIDGDFV